MVQTDQGRYSLKKKLWEWIKEDTYKETEWWEGIKEDIYKKTEWFRLIKEDIVKKTEWWEMRMDQGRYI